MRKKLLMLSALTCVAGGSVFLDPAESQDPTLPFCHNAVGSVCPNEGLVDRCYHSNGCQYGIICRGGTWDYRLREPQPTDAC